MTGPELAPAMGRATAAFRAEFRQPPTLIARAPGRVNLIGEHLDYNGGSVLPIAIDRDCVCAGRLRTDGRLRARSLEAENFGGLALDVPASSQALLEAIAPHSPHRIPEGDWRRYVLGTVFETLSALDSDANGASFNGADLVIASDVPVGSGLSSSAAIEVAVASWINEALGGRLSPARLAIASRDAEHRFAGSKCGLMDQMASALSREGCAMLLDCAVDPPRPDWIRLPDDASLLVVDTTVRHQVTGPGYEDKVDGCAAAARILGVRFLAEIEDPADARLAGLADLLKPLARHVVTEQRRVLDAVECIRLGDVPRLGHLMTQSHASLRLDFGVSCPELDLIVESALNVPGVHGARMTGAGFGGSAIVLHERAAGCRVIAEIDAAFNLRFGQHPTCFAVTPSAGASVG